MRPYRLTVVASVAAITSALITTPALAVAPGTVADATGAMHDEATAYADYRAWAAQADAVGDHTTAVLLGVIAAQERDEHFLELSDIAGTVRPSRENLTITIQGEDEEATRTYPEFQRQALADGDPTTAALFAELAVDEGTHRDVATKARRALCHHTMRPRNPEADPVPIVQQPPQATGRTLANVRTAMRGEAYASARYRLFAQRAYRDGLPWLGELFEDLAEVELTEHYAELANRYGLVGSLPANVAAAVAAEEDAVATYARIAAAATAAGDAGAAGLFTEIGTDEAAHRILFDGALG